MSAFVEAHSHDGVARLKKGIEYSEVGLCARVRLNIGVCAAEKLHCTIPCKIFYSIHKLAAAVIAVSRISFRIFVSENRSHSRHNSLACPVLRSNQFNM